MKFLKKVEEHNFITYLAIKRSIIVVNGKITVDPSIIGSKNPNEMGRILKSIQKRYENGFTLESVCEKLHFILNWRLFEFYPAEECLEKYLWIKSYYLKMLKGDSRLEEFIIPIEGMIQQFEKKTTKNRS